MKAHILLVDDDATIRELLGVILRGNYQLSEADSGAALKQAFARPQPDVILLDIKLPDADGLELLPQIKKQWPDTEVIILTGNATFELAVEIPANTRASVRLPGAQLASVTEGGPPLAAGNGVHLIIGESDHYVDFWHVRSFRVRCARLVLGLNAAAEGEVCFQVPTGTLIPTGTETR